MTIKLDTHKTEFPMDINDMAKNQGETKNNDVPINNYDTAPDQTRIAPESPNIDYCSSFYKASTISPDKDNQINHINKINSNLKKSSNIS